jgi:hypothetical protein
MNKFKNSNLFLIGMILIGTLVLVGCAGIGSEDPSPTVDLPQIGEDPTEEEIIALVKADLAVRKGVDVEEIGHPSVEQVVWGDTSLGCPVESMMYAEVETPGYQILLSIGGPASIEQFDYRTDLVGNFVLCEN